MDDDRIVKNVPKTYQARAKKLIGYLKDYTTRVSVGTRKVKWSSMEKLPGSNITILVNDIIMKAKNTKSIQLEESLSFNNLVKLNFLAVSSPLLKSRES